jgi:hypothetical protein
VLIAAGEGAGLVGGGEEEGGEDGVWGGWLSEATESGR